MSQHMRRDTRKPSILTSVLEAVELLNCTPLVMNKQGNRPLSCCFHRCSSCNTDGLARTEVLRLFFFLTGTVAVNNTATEIDLVPLEPEENTATATGMERQYHETIQPRPLHGRLSYRLASPGVSQSAANRDLVDDIRRVHRDTTPPSEEERSVSDRARRSRRPKADPPAWPPEPEP
jgi:hypothetical protein